MTPVDTLVRPDPAPPTAAPAPDAASPIDLRTTLDEALRLLPCARVVLHAFRVDACRGGARTIAEAAHAADLEPVVLLDALRSTVGATYDPSRCGGAGRCDRC